MAAVLGTLTTLAFLIYWVSRAAQGAHHITGAATQIANLPRKLRYQKRMGRSGLDLIEDAREAAAVLMVATARLSGTGRVSSRENDMIEHIAREDLGWTESDVEEFVLNIRWLTRDYKQPDTVLRPMLKHLRNMVSSNEAAGLRDMMERVARIDGATDAQRDMIHRYSEGMDLVKEGRPITHL